MAIELITTTHPADDQTTLQTLRSYNYISQSILYNEATQQAICYNQIDWGAGLDAITQKRLPNFVNTYHYHHHLPPPKEDKKLKKSNLCANNFRYGVKHTFLL
jgi:hypothetical protein